MVNEIVDELFGLGPIEPLLADAAVSDILVNGPDKIYVEKGGVLERTDLFFNDTHHLMRIIDRIVSRVGRRVDESSPMVDARLPDGSRVNATSRAAPSGSVTSGAYRCDERANRPSAVSTQASNPFTSTMRPVGGVVATASVA